MAIVKTTKRTLGPQFRTEYVTLTLTPEEAYALVMIVEAVGGDPDNSPRKFIDCIYKTLSDKIKPPYGWDSRFKVIDKANCATYFKDNTLNEFLEKAAIQDNKCRIGSKI